MRQAGDHRSDDTHARSTDALRIGTVLLTALALLPSGAHVMALPNKIGLPQSSYLIAQGIYAGWWLGGLAWAAALVANAGLAVVLRRRGAPWRGPAIAAALIVVAFAVFLVWTQPANLATANWTFAPADWEALRRRWEWSHATNAVLLFLALACSVHGAVQGRPGPRLR